MTEQLDRAYASSWMHLGTDYLASFPPFFAKRGRSDYITWTRSAEGAEAFGEPRARLTRS